jgi:MFS transporter, DHA2 family, multidrug resistance protein
VSAYSPLSDSLLHGGLPAAQAVVQSNAQILSYLDVYWLFGLLAFGISPFALLLKTPKPGAPAGGH